MDIQTLSVQQLNSIKKQLDDEIEHLTTSFEKLKAAQSKFGSCTTSIRRGISEDKNGSKDILAPLTASLYVPAKLAHNDKVLVDVGTGFYLEKTTADALDFYKRKGEELGKNMKDLEKVVQGKTTNLRAVEEGCEWDIQHIDRSLYYKASKQSIHSLELPPRRPR